MNFGAFLTPQGEIVNSGSIWTHTFLVDELFKRSNILNTERMVDDTLDQMH